MNPFDDSVDVSQVAINPFDDDDDEEQASVSNNALTDTDSVDDAAGDAPAEASWQYLGDLPYRRVPIYSNVRWSGKNNSKGTTTTNTSVVEDLFHQGLASFPPAAVKHHPKIVDAREVEQLLRKTTVTKCVGCPNGGPIAVMTLPLTSSQHWTHTELRILTVSGLLLARMEFPPHNLDRRYSPSDVLSIGFTSRWILVIVLKDSLCLTFDVRGEEILPPFHILPRGEGIGSDLQLAHVYEGGVAVLATTKDSAIVELFDHHDDLEYLQTAHVTARRVFPASSTGSSSSSSVGNQDVSPPHYAVITQLPTSVFAASHLLQFCAIAVLPRVHTTHRHPEVFLSTSDNSVIVVNVATTECVDVDCRERVRSPIVDMSFAPNGRFLACFTEASMLTVISTSFETKVLDFDTSEGSSTSPLEMKWCGEDSVVLHWKTLGVLMVGPYGDWLRFPYEGTEHVFLLPEMDCCRVITDSSVEILQRVPPATALLLRIGSIESTAMLLDAADAYHSGSPSSDETARAIIKTGVLGEAIETCTDSALKEFDIFTQKRLLRAASYGMHFSFKSADDEKRVLVGGPVTGSDPESGLLPSRTTVQFVNAARKLRILNALRNPDVGFVLTSNQFDAMTPSGVVARLIAMNNSALAVEISKYLCLPKAVQLYARASKAAAFVEKAANLSDTETAERATQIINGDADGDFSPSMNRGGYATVAMAANRVGRTEVAKLVLRLESSVADKVPALIATGNYAGAIAVATTERDADFIFSTLMEYERSCMLTATALDVSKAQTTFLGTVVSKFTPEAFHTLRRYRQTKADVKNVTSLLRVAQRYTAAGTVMAQRALKAEDPREKQGMLQEASKLFGQGKETAFHKSCTDDYLELLKDQEILRNKYVSYDVSPSGLSVTGTIASVIHFAAENLREQNRLFQDVEKLARKFRISEKRLWHIKVKAFAESNQWSNLRLLADSKTKSPIGMKPFARAAIKGKQPEAEIHRYIKRVSFPEEKYDLYCEACLWKNALEMAFEMRDHRRIVNVKSLCNSSELQLLAEEMMGRLAS